MVTYFTLLLSRNSFNCLTGTIRLLATVCCRALLQPARPVSWYTSKQMKKRHISASGMYLCRWPNGDFSIVKARNKREAILLLDELGPAELPFLVPMHVGMFDFGLTD